jgi:hypothetical protein
MKKVLIFVLLLVACGDEDKEDDRLPPETGIFNVVSTIVGKPCPDSTTWFTIDDMAVSIDKIGSDYTISLYDDSTEEKIEIAESDDGYDFIGGISGNWLKPGCHTAITWAVMLEYLGGGFTGINTNHIIIAGCSEADSCSEEWNVKGVKR